MPLPQPSPSALAPTPEPTAPPRQGAIRYLGVNDVLGLAFAPGGALWTATTGGVARWDLAADTYVQYTAADGVASDYVTGVAVAAGGDLWFSTGGGVNHFDGSSWTTYTAADGLAAGTPQAVAVTPQGEVWVGTTDGVSHFSDGVWTSYLPGVRAWDVDAAPSGDVWFANHGAGVYRYTPADGTWTNYTEADGQPLQGITALTVGPASEIYAYENWAGVYRFDGAAWQQVQEQSAMVCALAVSPQAIPWIGTCGTMHSRFGNLIHGADGGGWIEVEGWHEVGQPAIHALAFGTGDVLAVATELGIAVRQGGAWRTLRGGPARNRVTAAAVTPDGAAWFGFGDDQFSPAGGGVTRFVDGEWQYFLGDANVRVLAVAPDGSMWAGTGCSVQQYSGDTWQMMAECDDLGVGNVLDFAFGPSGEVWVATGMSLARYNGKAWEVIDKLVHSIAVTPGGTLWASGWEGTQDSFYTARFDTSAPLSAGSSGWTKTLDSSLASLVATPDGAVWGVEGERGLLRFDGEAWAPVPGPDGGSVYGALTLAPAPLDGTGGALWFGGSDSLARFDGQEWVVYSEVEGAQALTAAADGTVWLGTDNGVVRFRPGNE